MNCVIHLKFSESGANNSDCRTGKRVNTALDWTGHVVPRVAISTVLNNNLTNLLMNRLVCPYLPRKLEMPKREILLHMQSNGTCQHEKLIASIDDTDKALLPAVV